VTAKRPGHFFHRRDLGAHRRAIAS
jgi:hypothetical protein